MAEPTPLLSLVVGETYRRRSLHERYGGQRQGGISTPRSVPAIFLFTSDSGRQYGYSFDGFREGGVFWYTGEGQIGDMQMVRGNRAILNHEERGRLLHPFESVSEGVVRYLGRAVYLNHRWETAPDKKNNPRQAIVFQLAVEGGPSGKPISSEGTTLGREVGRLWSKSIDELRRLAHEALVDSAAPTDQRTRKVYRRNAGVKAYVLRRAEGRCEGCELPAPFKMRDGNPYLEPHHIRRLADEGPDHPMWVAALCPNCHRRVHHGEDGTAFNEQIAQKIQKLEQGWIASES